MATRIAVAAVTGRIYMGKASSCGREFAGPTKDITSDVLKALIDKAEYHGGDFQVDGGGRKWAISVKEVFRKEEGA